MHARARALPSKKQRLRCASAEVDRALRRAMFENPGFAGTVPSSAELSIHLALPSHYRDENPNVGRHHSLILGSVLALPWLGFCIGGMAVILLVAISGLR